MKSFPVNDVDKIKSVTVKKNKSKKLKDKIDILSKHKEDLTKCINELKKNVKKKKNCFVESGNNDIEYSKDREECTKRETTELKPELFDNVGSTSSSNALSLKCKKKKKKTSLLSLNIEPEQNVNQKETSSIESVIRSNDVSSKHKKKKKKTSILNQNERSVVKIVPQDSIKKKQKHNMFNKHKSQTFNQDNSEYEKPKRKKKKLLNVTNDEYKPGMLSDMIQIKKYGQVIIPWDPSFGLDPSYKIPDNNEEGRRKLKINPLFDLSKRKNEGVYSVEGNTQNAIFVGNLPNDTGINELKRFFGKIGLILHAKLRRKEFKVSTKLDAAKKDVQESNQHALIKFSSFESCKVALKMNGELYKGHHLRVTLAKEEGNSDPSKSIFVGNLPFNAKDDDLWKAFEDCGAIESVRVVRDGYTGKGRGFGYINFKSTDSVEKAVKLDGMTILDREVRVRINDSDARSLSNLVTVKRKRRKSFRTGRKRGNSETSNRNMNTEKVSDGNHSSENIEQQSRDSQDQESNSNQKKQNKKKKLHKKATNQVVNN